MDVEEMKVKEDRLMKAYLHQQDEGFTLSHVKAGRRIMQTLKLKGLTQE